ncbi:MAG TPA: MbtH family protein [Candidatus Dormibacteraeota bacterium]
MTDTKVPSTDEEYVVVKNHEGQYSVWPSYRPLPLGWRAEGTQGSRELCLDRIEEIWT